MGLASARGLKKRISQCYFYLRLRVHWAEQWTLWRRGDSPPEAVVLFAYSALLLENSTLWPSGDRPPEATVLLHARLVLATLSGHGKRCRRHVANAFNQRSFSCTEGSLLAAFAL